MNSAPFWRTRRACRRDTLRSVKRMVLPSSLPIVISSRASGTTVVLPSSSSIVSLNTAEIRRVFRLYLVGPQTVNWLNALLRSCLFDENQGGRNHHRHTDDERGH